MHCKHLKIKLNKTLECKKQNKIINIKECSNCKYRDYEEKEYSTLKSKTKMKQRTSKQAKLEKDRFSLFTNDLTKCIICGKPNINKHEIFYGSGKRKLSIKYGLVIPLCAAEHHNQVECLGIHFDKKLRDEWHKKGQIKAMEHYGWTVEEFIEIFGKSYLK